MVRSYHLSLFLLLVTLFMLKSEGDMTVG